MDQAELDAWLAANKAALESAYVARVEPWQHSALPDALVAEVDEVWPGNQPAHLVMVGRRLRGLACGYDEQ